MGGACSMHGLHANTYKYWLESLAGRDSLDCVGMDGTIILK
jgi:hypothetical protein